jgi:NADH-quinone oxidoreductase subunit E
LNPLREQRAKDLLAEHHHAQSALIPFLQFCQEQDGYVTDAAIGEAATLTGLTTSEVESIASFYSLLFRKPVGKHVIQVCRTLACMLAGADELQAHVRKRLGLRDRETSSDGTFTYEEVECLAACDQAPCLQHNLRHHYRVTPEAFDALLEQWRAEAPAVALPSE